MNIAVRRYELYQEDEILPLYGSVGWTNYTRDPQMLEKAYRNSLLTLGAYDGEKLVGVIRAVGDGCSIVLIQDILVLPEYQRKGIGTALMKAILGYFSHVYQIQLATDNTEKTVDFYKAMGLTPLEELGCRGFLRMNL